MGDRRGAYIDLLVPVVSAKVKEKDRFSWVMVTRMFVSVRTVFIRSRFHFWLPGVIKKQSRTAYSVDMILRLVFLLINLLNLAALGLPLAADEYSKHDFPPGFIFGSGTSAYQVHRFYFFYLAI